MKLLRKLLDAFGTSGHEGSVRDIIHEEIKDVVDNLKVDVMGNLVAHKEGKRPRIMLAAHLDEVGLMVKGIDEDGTISCVTVGSISSLALICQRVTIQSGKKPVPGMVTTRVISSGMDHDEIPETYDLIVDTGMTREELETAGVEVGSYIEFDRKSEYLGYGKKISGKARDDRVGCYILIELMKQLKNLPHEIFYVFTVQEEIGLFGSKTASFTIEPDWCIAIDATVASDLSEGEKEENIIRIGDGPCLTVMDEGFIANKVLNDTIRRVAKGKGIKIQFEVGSYGTTDASSVSISKGGVPATVIGIPVRNIHTTAGISSLSDIRGVIKLMVEVMQEPPEDLFPVGAPEVKKKRRKKK